MKILIADDTDSVRRSMRQVIEDCGYDCIEAENGRQAIARLKLRAHQIVMLILDWKMPLLDGHEVLKQIRAEAKYDHIPILMISSHRGRHYIVDAIRAGATDYLVKPFRLMDLAERITTLLARPQPGTRDSTASKRIE